MLVRLQKLLSQAGVASRRAAEKLIADGRVAINGETVRAMGIEVPPSMGISTSLNFQPTGDGNAAINGDFVMTADEVDPVIAALRQNDIQVVELHHHLTDEEPRLFFMHFWANDDALRLARGLRAALDRTNVQPPAGP